MSSFNNSNAPENSTQKTVLILIGPPGSGKGTQAVQLSKEFNLPHISTGDLFRDNISRSTDLGRQAKAFVESGRLSPDSLVLEMLFDRVSQPDCSKGYLLDGFPRTLAQAEAFENHIANECKIRVFNLAVPDDVIEKRIAGRLTCKQCGHIQNKYSSPPKQEGLCDLCGSELYQRPDDYAAVVQERLRVYHQQTKPLIGHYTAQGSLITVDGTADAAEVNKQLRAIYNRI